MPKSKELISSDDDSGSDTECPELASNLKQKKHKQHKWTTKKKKRKPKPKKKKVEKKPEKKEEIKPDKKSSKTSAGENMFQLSRMRFATVSEFRGKVMVGIREYYEADGDLRPGRKGISLTLEQWKSLKDQMDDIDEAIKDLE